MNRAVAEVWLHYLTYWEFDENITFLRSDEDTYNSYGVLCWIAESEGIGHWGEFSTTANCYPFGDEGFMHLLPDEIIKWASIGSEVNEGFNDVMDFYETITLLEKLLNG